VLPAVTGVRVDREPAETDGAVGEAFTAVPGD